MMSDGRRILVVEDEALICLLIETILQDAGYDVTVASTVAGALQAIEGAPPHAAVLDVHINGETVLAVAGKLAAHGVPFVFTSGGGAAIAGFEDRPRIGKPFQEAELLSAVARLIG